MIDVRLRLPFPLLSKGGDKLVQKVLTSMPKGEIIGIELSLMSTGIAGYR